MTYAPQLQRNPGNNKVLHGLVQMILGGIGVANGIGPFFREIGNAVIASSVPGSFVAEQWSPAFLLLPALFLFGGLAIFTMGFRRFREGTKQSKEWLAQQAGRARSALEAQRHNLDRAVGSVKSGNYAAVAQQVKSAMPMEMRPVNAWGQQLPQPQQAPRPPQQAPRPPQQAPRPPQQASRPQPPKPQQQRTLQPPVQRIAQAAPGSTLAPPAPADRVVPVPDAATASKVSVLTHSSLTTSSLMASSLTTSSLFRFK